ncbi:MAG: ATP-binding cassette domain-containing protein [Chloroflexi bacterium]|nr:ATP-binding cassette domain-containing protein [Chloroflexota bacterium]
MTANTGAAPTLLDVSGLQKFFPIRQGLFRRTVGYVRAVDDVSFTVTKGETLALVGESGCGKTTTARAILRAVEPTGGTVKFLSQNGEVIDVTNLPRKALQPLRKEMQLIFQDPWSSLNPRMTLLDLVGEPLLVHGVSSASERQARVEALLKRVGLRPEYMGRYPHAFSGGQRQRIGIARALALRPSLVVADEPVSALDVSVQAQVLNLLLELQEEFGLTYLFVSHDLAVVKHLSDRVAVMYAGKIVEMGIAAKVFAAPQHPYTEALLSAVPEPNPDWKSRRIVLEGDVPDPASLPTGCAFHPRCRHVIDRCLTEAPVLQSGADGHLVRCHRASELSLSGVVPPSD